MEKLIKCRKCNTELTQDNFYYRKDSGSYRTECKQCTLEYNKKNSHKYKGRYTERQKEYATSDRRKQVISRYVKSSKGKENERRRRVRDNLKVVIRAKTNKAVLKGILSKPDTCEFCYSFDFIEAHHHWYCDYYKYDVVWLCKKCHTDIHTKIHDGVQPKLHYMEL